MKRLAVNYSLMGSQCLEWADANGVINFTNRLAMAKEKGEHFCREGQTGVVGETFIKW